MILNAEKKDLMYALSAVQKVIPDKPAMEILSNVELKSFGGFLFVTGFDLSLGITAAVNAEIVEDDHICLDARLFLEIIRKAPDELLTLQTDMKKKILLVQGKNAKMKLPYHEADAYPSIPNQVQKDNTISLPRELFRVALEGVLFACASENHSKKGLTGIHIQISGKQMVLEATDAIVCARREVSLAKEYEQVELILPLKAATELVKNLNGQGESFLFGAIDNVAAFFLGGLRIVTRLIEDSFLDFRNIIHEDYETQAWINRNEFEACIGRSVLFSEGKQANVKNPVYLELRKRLLSVEADSAICSLAEELETETMGKDQSIALNPKKLLSILKTLDDEFVKICMEGEKRPFVVKGDSYVYLLLPVNKKAS